MLVIVKDASGNAQSNSPSNTTIIRTKNQAIVDARKAQKDTITRKTRIDSISGSGNVCQSID